MTGAERGETVSSCDRRLNANAAARLQHGSREHISKLPAFLIRQERPEPRALVPHRKRKLNCSVCPLNAREAHPRRIKCLVSAVTTSIDLREPDLFMADRNNFTATRIRKVPAKREYDQSNIDGKEKCDRPGAREKEQSARDRTRHNNCRHQNNERRATQRSMWRKRRLEGQLRLAGDRLSAHGGHDN